MRFIRKNEQNIVTFGTTFGAMFAMMYCKLAGYDILSLKGLGQYTLALYIISMIAIFVGCNVDYRHRTKWRKSEDKRIVPDMIGCCVGGFCVFLLLSLLLLVSKEFTIVVDALIGFYIGATYRTHLEKLEI